MLGLNWLDEPDCLLSLPRVSSLGRKLSLITQSGAIFARSPPFLLGQTCPEGGFGAARWQGWCWQRGAPLPCPAGERVPAVAGALPGRSGGCTGSRGSSAMGRGCWMGFLFFPEQRSNFELIFPRTTQSTQTTAAQILHPAVGEPIKERVAIFYFNFF